jgi:hypothetical protein
MLKTKNSGMTVVHGDELFFVSYAGEVIRVDHTVSLDQFLEDDFALSSIPAAIRGRNNRLLVMPDYWIGQTSLTLQSQKRSIVAPFVERKLASEHPELSDIGLFFDYAFSKEPSERGGIYAFFLQDPLSYQLYQRLATFNMAPVDITIPAYVWGKKLEKAHPKLADSGVGLIQKLSSACYLYFYHKGQFLFSRRIQFSDSAGGGTEALDALTYEINQSFYLFSQKEKAELEHIFIHSSRREDAADLAESLGREVHSLEIGDGGDASVRAMTEMLGPCGVFTPNDLFPARNYMSLAQRDHARDREWYPVQMVGVIVGILLFLLLGGGHFFLLKWSKQAPGLENSGLMASQSSREIIQQYNEALDFILQETRRPSAWKTMLDLAGCFPINVRIKTMTLLVAENPNLALTCVVRAGNMAEFISSLSLLLENMGKTFTTSPRLEKRDIELGEVLPAQGYTDYTIQFKLGL